MDKVTRRGHSVALPDVGKTRRPRPALQPSQKSRSLLSQLVLGALVICVLVFLYNASLFLRQHTSEVAGLPKDEVSTSEGADSNTEDVAQESPNDALKLPFEVQLLAQEEQDKAEQPHETAKKESSESPSRDKRHLIFQFEQKDLLPPEYWDQPTAAAPLKAGEELGEGRNGSSALRGSAPGQSGDGKKEDKPPLSDLEFDWWQYTYFQQTRHIASQDVLGKVKVQPLRDDAPPILCVVNTVEPYHSSRGVAVRDTWGRKCDELIFFSNATDPSLPAEAVEADDTHTGLWMKHRAYMRTLYERYLDKYEWFFKADDDAYVLVENLKNYLASSEIQENREKPLLLGHRRVLPPGSLLYEMQREGAKLSEKSKKWYWKVYHKYPKGFAFTVGGCGYVMNRAYVKLFVEIMDEDYCLPNDLVPDDWAIQFCMQFKDVHPLDTRDSKAEERFHQFEPWRVMRIPTDEFTFNLDHPWGYKNGKDCCSTDSIAFHYMYPPDIYMLHHHFYQEPLQKPETPYVCPQCYKYRGHPPQERPNADKRKQRERRSKFASS